MMWTTKGTLLKTFNLLNDESGELGKGLQM
jgi:hypothetical protein